MFYMYAFDGGFPRCRAMSTRSTTAGTYVYLDLGDVFRPAVNYSILISCDDESYIFFNFIW